MRTAEKLLKIDIGCGPNKKEGCLGIDCTKFDNVDYVLDVTKERLPLDDRSAGYIYSSHFFEHIKSPNLIFPEISRVATDGATLEIWTPYAYSNDAFCYGHEIFFTEEHWQHICVRFPEFYFPIINARWLLRKIVYVVDTEAYNDVTKKGFDIEFAIKYFKGVVREIGIFIEVRHDKTVEGCVPKKYFSFQRDGNLTLIE
jgi:ubiquinone/menaquinone biosynthesis C-methylase UbiE